MPTYDTDIDDTDLTGKMVKIRATYTNVPSGVFMCSGGFGCKVGSSGKVFGKHLVTGETTYTRRHWIEGWASKEDEALAAHWANVPLAKLNLEISGNILRSANESVDEVARDDAGRVTKEQMRAIMFNLLIDVNAMHGMMREVVDAEHTE